MTSTLNSCPFCDGLVVVEVVGKKNPRYLIECHACRGRVTVYCNGVTEAEAVAKWNSRTSGGGAS